jgi:hypothetical protein
MKRPELDDGAIAILVAVLSVALFMFGAIVVDLGLARDVKQQAQDSADAATLAAASDLQACTSSRRCRPAVAAAKSSADSNFRAVSDPALDWAGCRATPPEGWLWRQRGSGTPCIMFGWPSTGPTSGPPPVVFVALPARRVPSFFGGLVGYKGLDVTGSAVAGLGTAAPVRCTLCILGAVTVGNGDIKVTGGGSVYAGSATASQGGNLTVASPGRIKLVNLPSAAASSHFSPAPAPAGVAAIADPFNGQSPPSTTVVAAPTSTPSPPVVAGPGDCPTGILLPGRYDDDLTVATECTMSPGVYEFSGDVEIVAGGRLRGVGATIVLDEDATLSVGGNGISIDSPADPRGFVLFADDENDSTIVFNGDVSLGGNIYARRATLQSQSGTHHVDGVVAVRNLATTSGRIDVSSAGIASQQQPGELALVR